MDLIDRAAELGYQALAITLHDKQLDVEPLMSYARDRGLLIIPGIERSIHGRHLLDADAPLVDAIEANAMYTRQLDFNKAAVRWARPIANLLSATPTFTDSGSWERRFR